MHRCFPVVLLLLFTGCDNSPDPQQVLESSRKSTAEIEDQLELVRESTTEAQKTFDDSLKSPQHASQSRLHPAEVLAEQLVSEFSSDELSAQRPTIAGLRKLDTEEREEVYQTIQKDIQAKQWNLWFTVIVVSDGRDDVATCYFRSGQQDHVVVRLAYYKNSWIVAACETTGSHFARREDQTLDQHVTEEVKASREQGAAWKEGPLVDGLYFREHQSEVAQ